MRKVWPGREYRDHGPLILTEEDCGGGFPPIEITEEEWKDHQMKREEWQREQDWIVSLVYGA